MTMSEKNPPTASGNLNKDCIVSDANMFENFAVHYSKVLHNDKKKVHEYLQEHAPRRSPRLAEKKKHLDDRRVKNKKTRKHRRSYSPISESNPTALVPVMLFNELKGKRKSNLVTTGIKGKPIATEKRSRIKRKPIATEKRSRIKRQPIAIEKISGINERKIIPSIIQQILGNTATTNPNENTSEMKRNKIIPVITEKILRITGKNMETRYPTERTSVIPTITDQILEIKAKPILTEKEKIDDIIVIKDDDDDDDDDSISAETGGVMGTSGFNNLEYKVTYDQVHIRIERNSSDCSSPIDVTPEPMQQEHFEQRSVTEEYIFQQYRQPTLSQNCQLPSDIYANQIFSTVTMHSAPVNRPLYQAHAPQSYPSQNPSSPFISSVPPPSLTPDSPSYSPYPDIQPNIPSQFASNMTSLPYNTHVMLNDLQPNFECNGKNLRGADITLCFGDIRLKMRGYFLFNSLVEYLFFEHVFIPQFTCHNTEPNDMPQHPNPQSAPNPEYMYEPETMTEPNPRNYYQNHAPREYHNLNERLNSTDIDESMDTSDTEEPVTMGYGANRFQDNYNILGYMEIDSLSDTDGKEKNVASPLKNIQQRPIHQYFCQTPKTNYILPSDIGVINPGHSNHATHMNGNIRLRTDLINDGPSSTMFSCDSIYNYPVLIYIKYDCDLEPRFFIIHDNAVYQGTTALTIFKNDVRDPWLQKIRKKEISIEEIYDEEIVEF